MEANGEKKYFCDLTMIVYGGGVTSEEIRAKEVKVERVCLCVFCHFCDAQPTNAPLHTDRIQDSC